MILSLTSSSVSCKERSADIHRTVDKSRDFTVEKTVENPKPRKGKIRRWKTLPLSTAYPQAAVYKKMRKSLIYSPYFHFSTQSTALITDTVIILYIIFFFWMAQSAERSKHENCIQ